MCWLRDAMGGISGACGYLGLDAPLTDAEITEEQWRRLNGIVEEALDAAAIKGGAMTDGETVPWEGLSVSVRGVEAERIVPRCGVCDATMIERAWQDFEDGHLWMRCEWVCPQCGPWGRLSYASDSAGA